MAANQVLTASALTELWEQRWPECPPVAHWLRDRYPDRWVRFHSLPDSKRYPFDETEYAVVLRRHYTVLSTLAPGPELVVVTSDWTESAEPDSPVWPTLAQIAPTAWYWRTFLEKPDEDPEWRSYTQLYAETVPWQPGAIDVLLTAVADDELSNVILAPVDLSWLYHPYDGGADVILPTRERRDALKAQYRACLSGHPLGL
ncbi:hypothetical protein I6A84_04360 [Frankia sp. CNm7]|uniref:DUF3885 domain-containing protein n=1 Tax=Frankia nepalensis TaxID=1836974 RepID=A0A937ULN0_9ACTN|nr:hypothetical protein [Frankia nepalensis]MBL7498762.1 hypothetical protein [Frankia nepalensis]MBL7508374.1 hypothetical protein [Frankia nepalensis]MBL7517375.1 hypothetical protein [Frankia nepalensis]MBL7626203.1 hypothetical protein [Frankia nepalensis]